jgi:cadmium resistance protein CadD (predicted permease)
VGLLGFIPLAIGVRGMIGLFVHRHGAEQPSGSQWRPRRATDRAVGRSLTAAALITLSAGGDNLAAYIPLFRQGGASKISAIALVFAIGEIGVTAAVLAAGRYPRARAVMTKLGEVAVPLLLCGVGVLVLVSAGTLAWL